MGIFAFNIESFSSCYDKDLTLIWISSCPCVKGDGLAFYVINDSFKFNPFSCTIPVVSKKHSWNMTNSDCSYSSFQKSFTSEQQRIYRKCYYVRVQNNFFAQHVVSNSPCQSIKELWLRFLYYYYEYTWNSLTEKLKYINHCSFRLYVLIM